MEIYGPRIAGDYLGRRREQQHPTRKKRLEGDFKIEAVGSYLKRVREGAERGGPLPSRRKRETQSEPATLLPAMTTTTIPLRELPSAPLATEGYLHQRLKESSRKMTTRRSGVGSEKRYVCPHCPYGTDRRDLYTRHENIHREEKPFHCYVCYKPFNRADHVKKHFLRMHPEQGYELSRIRTAACTSGSNSDGDSSAAAKAVQQVINSGTANDDSYEVQHSNYALGYNNNNNSYQPQTGQGSNGAGDAPPCQMSPISLVTSDQADANCAGENRSVQNGGCNGKGHPKGGSKGAQERRYTCCYCSWSGIDNWCLKRHLNTHLKPYACSLCDYKAARAERLSSHVLKVHNKRQCSRCSFFGDDLLQLQLHQIQVHRVNSVKTSTPNSPSPRTNRHQQPIHSSGEDRPPLDLPVFPTSLPAITPAAWMLTASTLLSKCGLGSGNFPFRFEDWRNSKDEQQGANDNQTSGGSRRRSRKQSTPRKVMIGDCEKMDDEVPSAQETVKSTDTIASTEQESAKQESTKQESTKQESTKEQWNGTQQRIPGSKNSYRVMKKTSKRFLRCYLCPKDAPARGSSSRPYHTKASLALHTLWRHRRAQKSLESPVTSLSPKNILNILRHRRARRIS